MGLRLRRFVGFPRDAKLIGDVFDATEQSLTLDLIGCPLRAFGGSSGVSEGEIQALFFRYESSGGFDYATDVLIGPRTEGKKVSPDKPLTSAQVIPT